MSESAGDVSVEKLRKIVDAILPDETIRQLVLKTFADSIELANAGNPRSWSLYYRDSVGLRLRVASLKMMEIDPSSALYLLVDDSDASAEVREVLDRFPHPSAKPLTDTPNAVRLFIPADQLLDVLPIVLPAYEKLILRVRHEATRYPQHHRPEVVRFLSEETGRSLPDSPHPGRGAAMHIDPVRTAMEKAYPNPDIRLKVMTVLADSIELAHKGNPKSWCLTFPAKNYLRLNVGPMEVVIPGGYRPNVLTITIDAAVLPAESGDLIQSLIIPNQNNKSYPSAERIGIPVTRLDDILPVIQSAHDQLIVKFREENTGVWKHHSPEALQYVRDVTGRELPDPAYSTQATSPVASRVWKISPGSQGAHLKTFIQEGIIALGWGDAPMNLSVLGPKDSADIAAEFERQGQLTTIAPNGGPSQLWWFYGEMSVGDRVFLYANNAIRAAGIIVGDYYHQEDDLKYAHRRAVAWEWEGVVYRRTLSAKLDKLLTSFQTIVPLDSVQAAEIQSHIDRKATLEQLSVDWQASYQQLFANEGLHYTPWQQAVFFTALQAKGFVILSGISGTGKTKIAQAFSAALPQPDDGRNAEFLTVRPDWRDSKSLLGYHNPITDRYEWTPFLRFLLRARESWEQRNGLAWFVILDEMNLAHVEHYFAELLSLLESGRDSEGWTREAIQLSSNGDDDSPPSSLKLPPNLHIIGTVNLDETTHAFSPKVLDRAFAMELVEVSFAGFPFATANGASLDDQERTALLDAFSVSGTFPRIEHGAIMARLQHDSRPRDWLDSLNQQLRPAYMHFGYRVFDEILAFVDLGMKNGLFAAFGDPDDPLMAPFDAAVQMKVLPKFHGSRAKLEDPLVRVLGWSLDPITPDLNLIRQVIAQAVSVEAMEETLQSLPYRFPQTAQRAIRLLRTAYVDGFAAFG